MKPFRLEKVNSQIRQLVSAAIQNRLQDPRISPLTSVVRVEVSGDLESARVFVTVHGSENEQNKTMRALQSAAGYVQKLLSRDLHLRQCPHLSFALDTSLKKGNEVLQLIDEAVREREQSGAPGTSSSQSSEGLPE